MAEPGSKVPVKSEKSGRSDWHPLETLQREIDRVFEDFGRASWRWPLPRVTGLEPGEEGWTITPAIDVADTEKAFEVTAELPGMDEKNIELKVANGILSITGEKSEEKEEKKKDYYLAERRYGSFQRSFRLPDGVDADKIEARFKNGVLTVVLPKTPQMQKAEKKIAIKAA